MSEEAQSEVTSTRRPAGFLGVVALVVETIGVSAFVMMMAATLLQVVARYLQISADWTEELSRIVFLCAVMLGIAVAIYRREHIVVDFIYGRLTPRSQALLSIAFGIAILLFLTTWLRGAIRLMNLNAGTSFVMLPWFPVSALYGVEAGAIVLMIVFILADMRQRLQTLGMLRTSR